MSKKPNKARDIERQIAEINNLLLQATSLVHAAMRRIGETQVLLLNMVHGLQRKPNAKN